MKILHLKLNPNHIYQYLNPFALAQFPINGVEYNDFDDILNISELTTEELNEIKFKNQIIEELIKIRQNNGLTQKELEKITGVKQPFIARIESGNVDVQISTLLKILLPLGLTLAIVPKK